MSDFPKSRDFPKGKMHKGAVKYSFWQQIISFSGYMFFFFNCLFSTQEL